MNEASITIMLYGLGTAIALFLIRGIYFILDRRELKRQQRVHQERVNRKAPYKSEPAPALPHNDDILMWPNGTCVFRKNFQHEVDLDRYGHTYILIPVGSANHHLILNNLYGDTDSLETTENEATR